MTIINKPQWKWKASTFLLGAWVLSEPPISGGGRQEPLMPYPSHTPTKDGKKGHRWLHYGLSALKEAKALPDWFAEGLHFDWFGSCSELDELTDLWYTCGVDATRRGFLVTTSRNLMLTLMEDLKLSVEEAKTLGHYLRELARGDTPHPIKVMDQIRKQIEDEKASMAEREGN